jgi:hypothetical protein
MMTQFTLGARFRRIMFIGIGVGALLGVQAAGWAQDGFNDSEPAPRGITSRSPNTRSTGPSGRAAVPNLSESTAILESAVRALYKTIEPGKETLPNELIAYADLRALRLYTGALEVAGWDLEQAASAYADLNDGRLRNGRNGPGQASNAQLTDARDRYLAFRETVRTLLYRVRSTAVAVEHQVSFCDPSIAHGWQHDVVPALLDTISATEPLFGEQAQQYAAYHVPGQARPDVIQTSGGIPNNAVEITKNPTFQPYDGRGRGQGRYFEVRAFGGPIRVKAIRYRSHENAFGVIGTSVQRELTVDQIASPTDPLYIPCNRERYVDLSDLEIDWESADNRRKTFGTIDVIADRPQNRDN